MQIDCELHAESLTRKSAVKGGKYSKPVADDALRLSGEYTFVYKYPLETTARFPHTLESATSAVDILMLAQKDYLRIYSEEEKAAGNPGHERGLLNRRATKGPYGIWGHDFSDLSFSGIVIDKRNKEISFSVSS